MGILDDITQMKKQNLSEGEMTKKLRERGASPKDINDAFNQSRIKDAVSNPVMENEMEPSMAGGGYHSARNSTKAQENPDVPNDEFYIPQSRGNSRLQPTTREYQEPQQNYNQDYPQQDYNQDYGYENNSGNQGNYEEYYPQQGYNDYYGTSADAGTMMEIAEQVFSEKIRKLQKQLEEFSEFRALAETKLNSAINRLNRIEQTMDKLQLAILDKVGSYGRGIESIKKEMSMMQDSFGKMIPKIAEHHHSTTHTKTSSAKKTSKNKSKK